MAALWSVFDEIEPSDIAKSSGDEETSLTAYRISEDDLISVFLSFWKVWIVNSKNLHSFVKRYMAGNETESCHYM
ncbi:hypothetical protein HanHA300_Chr13g0465031 [Helianthus annuus]|nr:hypothetical protein HanHA300_Chr13g0465031 [Helianthus annuus]KAJ0496206.1 hypothetical protein HanHA89_Chr13g0497061 [Helianthus annuus]KAJ0662280.1 hypothetical protein HanLR1_Chr13g0467641 [Helianthus annuus]